jgi:hypothetical protein
MATLKEEYETRKLARTAGGEPPEKWERTIRLVERIVPTLLAVLIPVAGGLWGMYVYVENQALSTEKARLDLVNQTRAKLVELQKPFIDLQFQTFREFTKAISNLLVFTGNNALWYESYHEYWRLHRGAVVLVEDQEVHEAKEKFGMAVDAYAHDGNFDTQQALRKHGEQLMVAMRNSTQRAWASGTGNLYTRD